MIIINLTLYIYIFCLIFFVGIFGIFLMKKNLILFLISMEIIFLSSNLILIVSSFFLDDSIGVIFSIFLLAIAANEVSIGLALLILYYRRSEFLKINKLNTIKS